jgi:hypothetical protein
MLLPVSVLLLTFCHGFWPCYPRVEEARYASWEPTSKAIPALRDRALAEAYLARSLRLWRDAAYGSYFYARIRQISERDAEATAFAVTDGRVTQRALLRLDPERLKSSPQKTKDVVRDEFVEAEAALGTHARGFPALTIDELYERCRREVLASHREVPVRMHFDRRGFLQYCGYASEDSSDCPSVSVQVLARRTRAPGGDLRRDLCVDYDGLAFTGTSPDWNAGCLVCRCQRGAEPPPPPVPMREPEDVGLFEAGGLLSDGGVPAAGELADICRIDPKACPAAAPPDGPWGSFGGLACMHLLTADCGGGAFPPDRRAPTCVGKVAPDEPLKDALARCQELERTAKAR